MTVIVIISSPYSLRGVLTRWMLELSAGVYVGYLSARVRDHLWQRIEGSIGTGKAIMVFPVVGEQRLGFKTYNSQWIPEDYDGIKLMRRPFPSQEQSELSSQIDKVPPEGWSIAARRRKYGRQKN
jgi:CRISPR-associated protein Cas2